MKLNLLPIFKVENFVKHFVGYGGVEGLAKVLNVLLSLTLAAVLSVSDYGLVATFLALELVVTEIILFGQNTFILRHYRIFEFAKFQKNYTISVYITLVSAILLMIAAVFLPINFLSIQNSFHERMSLIVLIFAVFIQANITLYLMYLRAAEKIKHYGILRISSQALKFVITLFLLSLFHDPLIYPYAVLISGLIIYLAILSLRAQSWRPSWLLNEKINKFTCVNNLNFSFPIAFHCVVGASYSIVDRILLAKITDIDTVAVYNFALTQGASVFFFINILAIVLLPKFYNSESLSESSRKHLNVFLVTSIIGVGILSLIVYLVIFPITLNFVSDNYQSGQKILPIVALAMMANCASNYAVYKLTALKLVKMLPIFTLLSLIITIFLNYSLIPRFGMMGAACALFISEFLYALILNAYASYGRREVG